MRSHPESVLVAPGESSELNAAVVGDGDGDGNGDEEEEEDEEEVGSAEAMDSVYELLLRKSSIAGAGAGAGASEAEQRCGRGGRPPRLAKQQSWSNDSEAQREQAWLRRRDQGQLRKSKSLTDEDLDELRGCIDLGFGFDLREQHPDRHLCDTLPALDLYYAVNRQFFNRRSNFNFNSNFNSNFSPNSRPNPNPKPSGTAADGESSSSSSSCGCPDDSDNSTSPGSWIISSPGDTPQLIKTRLRHWAQVVACSVRQSC